MTEERRHSARHGIHGSAFLVFADGRVLNVEMLNLSAGGASVTRPDTKDLVAELFAGVQVRLAGPAMPWERTCAVVAVDDDALHLKFVDDAPAS